MKKVLVIGPVFCDLLLDGFREVPSPGEEEYLDQIQMSIGGVAITAQALTQLGMPADLLSSVGDDIFGRHMLEELNSKGVSTSLVEIRKRERSNLSIIFPLGNDRSFLTQLMSEDCASEQILKETGELDLTGFSHIHISYSLMKHSPYRELIRNASDLGITVSTDLGFDEAKTWVDEDFINLEKVDYFFPNDKEAAILTGTSDMEEAINHLRKWVKVPIITRGGKGAVLLNEQNRFCRIPAPDVPVFNTTGAGDSFVAGFLYGIAGGGSLEESVLRGTICGSMTAGSKFSLSPHINSAELQKFLNNEKSYQEGKK